MTTKITEQNVSNLANVGVDWQSPITADGSTVTTAVAGRGYFIDTTSAAHTINLPASTSVTIGDTISIVQINGSNAVTIGRNGNKINGATDNGTLNSDGDAIEYVFVNATEGFKTVSSTVGPTFISATGGTVSNSGNFRIHTFTGDGNFVVSSLGNGPSVPTGGPNVCDYLVIAGGGGGGKDRAGGGGAGGYRESKCNTGAYTASPLATPTGITLTAATFPITVGGGGTGGNTPPGAQNGGNGSNSVFSTITSAGGGGGHTSNVTPYAANAGGSGGGGGGSVSGTAGAGNTPPVSPPQGNNGGAGQDGGNSRGAGGGGAGGAAANASTTPSSAPGGGNGTASEITGSSVTRAGGGGGTGTSPATQGGGGPGGGGAGGNPTGTAGTANTGGGGGGSCQANGATGGKGIVIIRYQYQG
mgnify:CR=1 FL=1